MLVLYTFNFINCVYWMSLIVLIMAENMQIGLISIKKISRKSSSETNGTIGNMQQLCSQKMILINVYLIYKIH
jgi:hypothetical protein